MSAPDGARGLKARRAGRDDGPKAVRFRLEVVLGGPLAERNRLLQADDIERSLPDEIDLAVARRPAGGATGDAAAVARYGAEPTTI